MSKDLSLQAFDIDNDEKGPDRLQEAIRTYTRNKKGKPFDKLTFGDYLYILLNEKTWPVMQQVFDMPSPEAVRSILDGVRRTRNDLAHFQGEITSDQRDQLRFCAEWLGRCQIAYQEEIEKEVEKAAVPASAKVGDIQEELAEEVIPSDSRYAPLGICLQGQPGNIDRLQMTYAEIEKIIGGSLPP